MVPAGGSQIEQIWSELDMTPGYVLYIEIALLTDLYENVLLELSSKKKEINWKKNIFTNFV